MIRTISNCFRASKLSKLMNVGLAVTLACLPMVGLFPSRLNASILMFQDSSSLVFDGSGLIAGRGSRTTSSEPQLSCSPNQTQAVSCITSTCLKETPTALEACTMTPIGHHNLILIFERDRPHPPGIGRRSLRERPFRIIREVIRRRIRERFCGEHE